MKLALNLTPNNYAVQTDQVAIFTKLIESLSSNNQIQYLSNSYNK